MRSWTMAVEAGASELVAVAVDSDRARPVDVGGPRRFALDPDVTDLDVAVDEVATALAAYLGGTDSLPDRLLMIIKGDATAGRFAELAEAAALVGLPDAGWLPDAVARAGTALRALAPGEVAVVVDARTADVPTWMVRAAEDGVDVSACAPLPVGNRLDDLLTGVVRAKLQLVAPAFAAALDSATDARARRDAAHLRRELRRARRVFVDEDGGELVVTAGGAEVSLDRDEFAQLVDHATRATITELLDGAHATAPILVADVDGPLVQYLVEATGSQPIVDVEATAALSGAAALLPRNEVRADPATDDQDDANGSVEPGAAASADPAVDELPPGAIPAARATPDRRPPRGAVPALSVMLVASIVGAVGVLVLGPQATSETEPAPSPAAIVEQAVPVPTIQPVTAQVVPAPAPVPVAAPPVATPSPVSPTTTRKPTPTTSRPTVRTPRRTVTPRTTTT